MSEPAVVVEGLRVTYRVRLGGAVSLREIVARGRRAAAWRPRQVHALVDLSFTLPPGRVLGIVGRNGAGKSTLLKVLAGVVPPTAGYACLRGEIGAVLDLGLGFNPALSGARNALLSALAAGHDHREVRQRLPEILDFADLGEFVDYPLRTYSTGMRARLAFAATILLDPDILLVDEALATGDAAFRARCLQRISDLCAGGRTALLASHSLGLLRELADTVLWLEKGAVVQLGPAVKVLDAYRAAMQPPAP